MKVLTVNPMNFRFLQTYGLILGVVGANPRKDLSDRKGLHVWNPDAISL